jgi:hypothetical protein
MKKGTLLETLETVLVVTVITMLIWLYAEGETIQTEERKITISFVAPTSGLAISVPNTEPGTTTKRIVTATLQASRGDWDNIKEWVSSETIQIEVNTLDNGITYEEQTINLLDALNNSPLAEVRAFVKEVTPPSVTVTVQKIVAVEMGLRVDPGELELTADEPTFLVDNVPVDKIQVELTTEDAKTVEELGLKLVVDLNELDASTLKEDTQNVIPVELSLPPELQNKPHIKLAHDSVVVSFLVDKLTEEIELPRVQVRLMISDVITRDYDILINPETQRIMPVTVKGSEEAISRIKAEPGLVKASITIKLSDLQEEPPHSAPVEIYVPKGVTVVSPDPLPTITYTYTVTELDSQP